MSTWQNRLDFKDLWGSHDAGKMTTSEVAKCVAKRIKSMKCFDKHIDILEDIADSFEMCSDDQGEFNDYLAELYDWGDTPIGQNPFKKTCWIATTF